MFTEMCGEDEKITVEKRILLDTIKEYSDHTTIHGINYVFASFLSFQDRLFWFLIFITGLVFSVYLSLDAFLDWRKELRHTELSVYLHFYLLENTILMISINELLFHCVGTFLEHDCHSL